MANEILTPATRYAQTENLPAGWYVLADMTEAVGAALQRFHDDIPRVATGGFSGAGTDTYDLSTSLGANWDEASAVLVDVAYPFTAATPNVLGIEKFRVVEVPAAGRSLVFTEATPAASEYIRVRFTQVWTEDTVPARYRAAVAQLAAAGYLRMIAARFAQQSEQTLSGDVFNRAGAAQTMMKLAAEYEAKYREAVGESSAPAGGSGEGGGPGAAVAVFNIDVGGQSGYGSLIDYGQNP